MTQSSTSNPFETASALVGDLQAQYDTLTRAIPKLKETQKELQEELISLNKQIVHAQEKLETLQKEITLRTDKFNSWQQGELANLDIAKASFAQEKSDFEAQLTEKAEMLTERKTRLITAVEQLESDRKTLVETQEEASQQLQASQHFAQQLVIRETNVKVAEQANTTMTKEQSIRAEELDKREVVIIEGEDAAKTALREAENSRTAAKLLLSNAKDRIAEVDAKEDANTQRSRLLDARERDLQTLKVALDDRRNVMISNGMLPS